MPFLETNNTDDLHSAKASKQDTICRGLYSDGCNKLNTIDWLSGYFYKDSENIPDIVEVRFKSTRKLICQNPHKLRISPGDTVVIETPTGSDIGMVSLSSMLVGLQLKKKEMNASVESLAPVIRYAGLKDIQTLREARALEYDTLLQARKLSKELNLEMKINDVEYQGDRKKATFYYTAEGRVDFRELIKVYAKTFRVKIEMRQIGIRQEAGRVGSLGDCGREICCSTWLTDFTTVPTIAAKQQNLYLNPAKLSGQCSRLKCCLNYELDTYLEALENFPDENIILKTEKDSFKVAKIDILRGIMWFNNTNEKDSHFYPISLDNIHKIIEMNNNKHFPPELLPFIEKGTPIITEDIVEEDYPHK